MKQWFIKHQWPIIIFGTIAIAILLLLSASAILNAIRESKVHYAQAIGVLHTDDQPGQALAIVIYVEKMSKDNGITAVCSAKVFGYDAKYIYGSTICAWSRPDGSLLGSGSDYSRYTYTGPIDNPTVTGVVSQGNDDLNPSLESIYPSQIYHIAMPNVIH